jgi:hypothetical protein
MSAMIFLRRLWKIRELTTSICPPNHHVNYFWDTKATIATLRAVELIDAAENSTQCSLRCPASDLLDKRVIARRRTRPPPSARLLIVTVAAALGILGAAMTAITDLERARCDALSALHSRARALRRDGTCRRNDQAHTIMRNGVTDGIGGSP